VVYTVPAAQIVGQQALTVTGLLQLVSGTNPPPNVPFPTLGSPPGAVTNLGPGQGVTIQAGLAPEVVRSFGLITCASVCYVTTASTTGYVYHANAGAIPNGSFNAAMAAIGAAGPPYNAVYVAYAHQNATDQGYQQTLGDLVNWGVPTNNIVEIEWLFLPQFGMNNLLQLGY